MSPSVGGLLVGNRVIPHLHDEYRQWRGHGGAEDTDTMIDDRLRRTILISGAITLHNAPEGLAMGIAFASGLEAVAFVLAVVIGLQNIPDGFAFAVPVGQSVSRAFPCRRYIPDTTLSGTVPQLLAAILGFGLVAVAEGVFQVAAGFRRRCHAPSSAGR